jgi:hypothetical protein
MHGRVVNKEEEKANIRGEECGSRDSSFDF